MFSRPDSSGWKPVAPDDAEHLPALHLEAHVTQGPDRGGLAAGAAMSDRTDGAAERVAQRPIAGGRLADAIALAEVDGADGEVSHATYPGASGNTFSPDPAPLPLSDPGPLLCWISPLSAGTPDAQWFFNAERGARGGRQGRPQPTRHPL